MTDIELEKFLLNLSGVSGFDFPRWNLRRFLIHDMPFAVLEISPAYGRLLNIKLNRGKIRELSARYATAVTEPKFYEPSAWICICLDAPSPMPDSAVFETLYHAYTRMFCELSALSRVAYLEKNPNTCDFDCQKLINAFFDHSAIDYSKRIEFLD